MPGLSLRLTATAATPSTAFRDRVHAGVLAAGSAPPPAASALALTQAVGAGSPWAALRASGKGGALLGIALLGLGFGSGYLASSQNVTPPPLPPAPVALTASEGPVFLVPADESTVATAPAAESVVLETSRDDEPRVASAARAARLPAPRASKAVASRAPSVEATPASVVAPASDVSAELTLLQRAERAVRAENPALARALTDEHADRFPGSALSEERSAIERMAHCQADGADTGERAASFLREHPKSVYASRLRELCRMRPVMHSPPALTKPSAAGH